MRRASLSPILVQTQESEIGVRVLLDVYYCQSKYCKEYLAKNLVRTLEFF